jgi:hypothetical protein
MWGILHHCIVLQNFNSVTNTIKIFEMKDTFEIPFSQGCCFDVFNNVRYKEGKTFQNIIQHPIIKRIM